MRSFPENSMFSHTFHQSLPENTFSGYFAPNHSSLQGKQNTPLLFISILPAENFMAYQLSLGTPENRVLRKQGIENGMSHLGEEGVRPDPRDTDEC